MNTESTDSNPLKPQQKDALIQYESIIQNYWRAPFEAGRALESVREQRLYLNLYPNFDSYTVERWDFCRSKADRLIGLWTVYQVVAPIGVNLENEYQARPLLGLTKEQMVEAGKIALEISGGKKLTAKHFQIAAQKVKPPHKKPTPPKAIPASAKSVAKVLALVSEAEAALSEDNNEKVLEALAAIKAFLAPPISDFLAKRLVVIDATPEAPKCDTATGVVTSPQEPIPVVTDSANTNVAPKSTPKPETTKTAVVSTSGKSGSITPAGSNATCSAGKDSARQPSGVRLGATEQSITRWNEVPTFVANWLLGQGHDLPSIACIKRNPLDFPASARIKQLGENWFIDVGDGRQKLMKNARLLLQKTGHDDIRINVQLDNGDTLTV